MEEVKGVASSQGVTGTQIEVKGMAGSPDRLVWRIQRRLQPFETIGLSAQPAWRDVKKLEARIRRLRAISDRLDHVRLSRYVAQGATRGVPGRVGGTFVAREV